VRVDVYRIRRDFFEDPIGFGLQRKRPDVSQSLMLNYSVAFKAMNSHSAGVVDLREGAISLAIRRCDYVNFVARAN
jgi:hypothetical protein